MIKVIIERHVEKGKDIAPLLRELRAAALCQWGYVTGETLVNTEDYSIITVVSSWQNLDAWKAWQTSETRAKLERLIEPLLAESPKVGTYQMVAVESR